MAMFEVRVFSGQFEEAIRIMGGALDPDFEMQVRARRPARRPDFRDDLPSLHQRAPLNDVHVRRAISYAFDYDGFNKDMQGGLVERNPVPIPNNMWGKKKNPMPRVRDSPKVK